MDRVENPSQPRLLLQRFCKDVPTRVGNILLWVMAARKLGPTSVARWPDRIARPRMTKPERGNVA